MSLYVETRIQGACTLTNVHSTLNTLSKKQIGKKRCTALMFLINSLPVVVIYYFVFMSFCSCNICPVVEHGSGFNTVAKANQKIMSVFAMCRCVPL